MDIAIIFILGMITGSGLFIVYGMYQLNKLKSAKTKITDEIKKKLEDLEGKRESIKTRLIKAQELTQQQIDLRAATEMPSKNAVHSRYKNGLIGEITKLEEEKIAILRSILDDGYDPEITVLTDDGAKQSMPLSQFVGVVQKKHENNGNTTPPSTPTSEAVKKVGKFVILKGGKDDGTTH